jgi:formyltetrahydrofolate deformylase
VTATATLLLSCPDRPGLVAAVADFVFANGGNIVHADQHTDAEAATFFQRVEFALDGFRLPRDQIAPAIGELGARYDMRVQLRFSDDVARVALMTSREPHCLYDLLARWKAGELPADIRLVISNHPDHADAAEHFGVPFHHLPVTPATKAEQERAALALCADAEIDLVVLARYMQILSPGFVSRYPERIVNIHHSFLPAFAGARPYHQAHERGVKVIGVTAHYVTDELDEGPIIDQDVVRVSHRDAVTDLVRKGRDLEKVVLARAVLAHLESRVLVYGRKTVVFR